MPQDQRSKLLKVDLEKLPRTVTLVRSERAEGGLPAGSPVLVLLDQAKLPGEESYVRTSSWREACDAIRELQVRGAPAIGIAGAAAVTLLAADLLRSPSTVFREGSEAWRAGKGHGGETFGEGVFWRDFERAARVISSTRPTAVNLSWAVDRASRVARAAYEDRGNLGSVVDRLFAFVKELEFEDEMANRSIGENGAALLGPNSVVLTHCNAGSLATSFFGTALGVVYAAAEQGKIARVYADETRPVGQGARLTAWELSRAGVPVTLICDNMAASVMASSMIDAVVVGADRIASNGDVANKIGTYGVAVLAKHHGIPFYVAAPSSTIDFEVSSGDGIEIEQRDASEVLPCPIEGVDVFNPSFDITPAHLVTKIITDRGVFDPCDVAEFYGRKA